MGLVPEEPGPDVIAGQRELLSRLRAVVEAKDAENVDAFVEGADRGEGGAAFAAAVRAGAAQGPQAGRAARASG